MVGLLKLKRQNMKKLITLGVTTIIMVGIVGFVSQYLDWSHLGSLKASGSDLLRQAQQESGAVEVGNPNLAEDNVYRNWSMYTNDEYRLTMRYPAELTVNASGAQLLSDQSTKTLVQFIKNGTANSRGASISVQVQEVGDKTLDKFVTEFNRGQVLLKQETTVDGIRALRLWVQSPLEDNEKLQEDYILVKKGTDIFIFSSAGDENRPLFEKMIKTVTLAY